MPAILSRVSVIFLVSLALLARVAHAQDAEFDSPYWGLLTFPVRAAKDLPDFFHAVDPRSHWQGEAVVTALSLGLWYYDQKLLDESQRFARHVRLISSHDDGKQTEQVAKPIIFGIGAPLNIPKTPNTILYYFGDGLTSFLIAGGLSSYSYFADETRGIKAATQILESITLAGAFVLPLKMATGRESPFRSSEERGQWRGFVGFKNYLGDVSKHDAYPSGHIATLTATVRVLAENYLEKSWILPVGYTAMGLLMFAMLNNGEHWASDYPLGIAIGYTAAGVVVAHEKSPGLPGAAEITQGVSLVRDDEGGIGIRKSWVF